MRTVQVFWLGVLVGVIVLAAAAAPVMVDRVEGSLRYEAAIPRRTFAPGEFVDATITVRNIGSTSVSLTFTSGQRYDLIVRRPRGDEVWRWSHDKAFIQVIQSITLKPQESLPPFRDGWDQRDFQGRRVDPGAYEMLAVFLGSVSGGSREVQLPPLPFAIGR